MKNSYWYFIFLLVLLLSLPENKRFMIILIASIMSVLMMTMMTMMMFDYSDQSDIVDNDNISENIDKINTTDIAPKKSEYIDQLINQPYNNDVVSDYYDRPAYEELFADYGLAKAQKRVLHNNDIMRENESKFQYNKFAPYFGDELDIYYEKVWFGPDS